ncbi:MAG: AraC family transcriptional regulator [Bacteroidales bacterium]|nr:AraC family transcriptional regulator [Bacteroidales bacterium]
MDISIYDNYSGADRDFIFFHIDGEYKMCDSLLAIICLRGRARFRIRLRDYDIRRGSYLLIGANDPFYIAEKTEDFRIDVVRAGDSIFDLSYDDILKQRLEKLIIQKPTNIINNKKLLMFHIIHSYLKVMIKERNDFYRDMIIFEYVKIFLYEACHIMDDTQSEGTPKNKERNITAHFFHLVENRYKENRKVEDYAERIGISAKHLAYVIKKTTGKYPSEWLENYVLLESKKLLRNTDLSVQEISYDLNFSTPSHFGKFFKNQTGMTPKKFRDGTLHIE